MGLNCIYDLVTSWERQANNQNCEGWVKVSGEGHDGGKDAILQEILLLARAPAGKRTSQRSPLYEWLWARHSTLVADLNPPRVPNWTMMADGFAKQGIMDGKGQPPTPTVVRKTWGKVNQAKGVRLRLRVDKNPTAAPEPSAVQANAASPTPSQLPPGIQPAEPDPPEGRYQFRFAGGPKVWTKDEPKPE